MERGPRPVPASLLCCFPHSLCSWQTPSSSNIRPTKGSAQRLLVVDLQHLPSTDINTRKTLQAQLPFPSMLPADFPVSPGYLFLPHATAVPTLYSGFNRILTFVHCIKFLSPCMHLSNFIYTVYLRQYLSSAPSPFSTLVLHDPACIFAASVVFELCPF